MTSCAILSVVAIPILVGVMKRFGYSDIEVLISAVVFSALWIILILLLDSLVKNIKRNKKKKIILKPNPGDVVNPDIKHTSHILGMLLLKTDGNCPCVIKSGWNKDTICPCSDYRSTGSCRCDLFIKDGNRTSLTISTEFETPQDLEVAPADPSACLIEDHEKGKIIDTYR